MGPFVVIGLIVVLGLGAQQALDPQTRIHRLFCTRCRRRAEYMQ